MKSIRRLVFCSALLSLFATLPSSYAADPTTPPATEKKGGKSGGGKSARMSQRIDALDEKLSLTADQKEKIKSIFESAAGELKTIHGDAALSEDDKKAKAKALEAAAHSQIRAILTVDQQKTFETMRNDLVEKLGKKGAKESK